MNFNTELFARKMADAMAVAMGQKAPGTTSSETYFHGPGGLFAGTCAEEQVLSLRMSPRGISQVLRALPSVFTHPEFAYITGVIETANQSEPSTECATCPSGQTQSCIQTAPFGFICRETDTITPNRAIERVNQCDFDRGFLNDLLGPADLFQPIRNLPLNQLQQIITAYAMVEVGILLQNRLNNTVWQGSPANNIGTGYAEFIGLDLLISTGKVDAYTGTTCPALDSDVKDFGYQKVGYMVNNGFQIVQWMEAMDAYLYNNAELTQMLPVEWVYVMRPELWYELSNIWPIAYHTTRNITIPANNRVFLDGADHVRMRDEMREGMFLWINGRKRQVITDHGILEYDSSDQDDVDKGCFSSNLYQLPVTYLGGRPSTYFEHKDYRQFSLDLPYLRGKNDWWTDDGRFLWALEQVKWCYTLSAKMEARIILRTPQLAGRINNIQYCPVQHFRSPDPLEDYFVKGGDDDRPTPSLWNDYNRL